MVWCKRALDVQPQVTDNRLKQHCQKLAPELIRAADGLHPLVPVYAVDCDDSKNKAICAEQVCSISRNAFIY